MKPFEKYVKIEEERYLILLEKEKRIKELEEENKKLNELVQFNVKTTATLTKRINKALGELKTANVDIDSVRLCEIIQYAEFILKGEE
jgi:uncharacterized protein YaaN involved in tellurite resistance